MTSVLDAWRAVAPDHRLASGSVGLLGRPVRAVARTRATPPHLPPMEAGTLLVADAAVVARGLDELTDGLAEAGLEPSGVWVVQDRVAQLDRSGSNVPVIAGEGSASRLADAVAAYLEHEADQLSAMAADLRLAGAEAALADPQPGAPAGVVAARLRRGVAVTAEGALAALNPRPAGTALATRFAAAHARLLANRSTRATEPRLTRDGLWILERPVGSAAAAWLFDDLPFGAVDRVALDALAVTLRALLRRQGGSRPLARTTPRLPPSTGDPMRDTLLAVARANGRIAPAARALGVHRNTVLYRLRRASDELGIDPRRPDDALRLLRSSGEA
ncbi:MAG: helix-turn-helix domain-containing protein [Chloroflexota bacterium]|nr:helix-turn-helix domain-containing protein [Chloroflexota bacterium]